MSTKSSFPAPSEPLLVGWLVLVHCPHRGKPTHLSRGGASLQRCRTDGTHATGGRAFSATRRHTIIIIGWSSWNVQPRSATPPRHCPRSRPNVPPAPPTGTDIGGFCTDVGCRTWDCLLRRGRKFPLTTPPLPTPEDILLPVQCRSGDGPDTALCFGDRIVSVERSGAIVDPLRTVAWPVLQPGDTVLVTPRDGDWCLMNRQPTWIVVPSQQYSGQRWSRNPCWECVSVSATR